MTQSWMELEVVSRETLALDIVGLILADPHGGELPPFSAGSHVDLEIAPGLIRQYSLCNAPENRDRYEVAILKDPGSRGGSVKAHESLVPGTRVRVSEPRNLFPLESSEARAILLGGGIGITPLLCMAERLSATGAPFELHYCSRSPERTAFRNRIARAPYSGHVQFHFDDGPATQLLDPKALFAQADPQGHVYVCGPAGYIDWIYKAAEEAGFPSRQIHREYFTAAPAEPVEGGETAFEIQIASTGAVFLVPPDKSVAAILEANGINVPISCEQGVCGTCITRLLQGEPDHRDMLALDGDAEFTPCCSRSFSPRLVLDL